MELSGYKFIENSYNSVFLIEGDEKIWLNSLGIKRLMLKTGRVLVYEIFPLSRLILDDKIEELHVRVVMQGDRSDYDNGILWMKLTNCKIKQSWIPDVIITRPDNLDIMRVYAVLSCDIEIM